MISLRSPDAWTSWELMVSAIRYLANGGNTIIADVSVPRVPSDRACALLPTLTSARARCPAAAAGLRQPSWRALGRRLQTEERGAAVLRINALDQTDQTDSGAASHLTYRGSSLDGI